MDHRDPLAELLAHLEHDGRVPLAWVVAHAPDGDLVPRWNDSRDVGALWVFGAVTATVRNYATLAAAAAELVTALVPPADSRFSRVATTMRAWVSDAAMASNVCRERDEAAAAVNLGDLDRVPQAAALIVLDGAAIAAQVPDLRQAGAVEEIQLRVESCLDSLFFPPTIGRADGWFGGASSRGHGPRPLAVPLARPVARGVRAALRPRRAVARSSLPPLADTTALAPSADAPPDTTGRHTRGRSLTLPARDARTGAVVGAAACHAFCRAPHLSW